MRGKGAALIWYAWGNTAERNGTMHYSSRVDLPIEAESVGSRAGEELRRHGEASGKIGMPGSEGGRATASARVGNSCIWGFRLTRHK